MATSGLDASVASLTIHILALDSLNDCVGTDQGSGKSWTGVAVTPEHKGTSAGSQQKVVGIWLGKG